MEDSQTVQNFNKFPLSVLLDQCKAQIQDFKSGNLNTDSLSCAEIVHQAANGNEEAFGILLEEISKPIIERQCPQQLREEIDDFVQQVNLRLIGKFHNQRSPFQASTFQAYHTYLNATIHSVVSNWVRDEKPATSLDQLQDESAFEPTMPPTIDEIERQDFFQRLLNLLPDPVEREVLRYRIALGETPDEIVEDLKGKWPAITKQEVYRLTERALRHLKNNPSALKIIDELR